MIKLNLNNPINSQLILKKMQEMKTKDKYWKILIKLKIQMIPIKTQMIKALNNHNKNKLTLNLKKIKNTRIRIIFFKQYHSFLTINKMT